MAPSRNPPSAHPESRRIRDYYESEAASWTRWAAGREYAVRERRRTFARLARAHFPRIDVLSICDIGCGSGGDLQSWTELGIPQSSLAGTELVAERARAASALLPEADIRQVDGFELPFADGQFNVTTASLVFSSVLDSRSRRWLFEEMQRVTAVDGMTIVYDMRITKPSNPAISRFTPGSIAAAPPDATYPVTPLLPALALLLSAPSFVRRPLVPLMPRTHAIWVWVRRAAR